MDTTGSIFVLTIGLIALLFCGLEYLSARRSSSWLPRDAEVTESGIVRERGRGRLYRPAIRYRYTIDGSAVFSRKVMFFEPAVFEEEARRFAATAAVGQRLTAYVNPANHEQSVIIPGVSWRSGRSLLIFGIGLTFIGFGGLMNWWK